MATTNEELLKKRIVFCTGKVNTHMADDIISKLLQLEASDHNADIHMYINSPGGLVTDGLAIYDIMQFIKPDVSTLCFGQAASMGALLLAGGAAGKRLALPHASVMIHQPLGGAIGQATDIEIHAREILDVRHKLNKILAKHTGQDLETIQVDTERDTFMCARKAQRYGIVDKVLSIRR